MLLDDTIAALASPPGPALRGIVRLSGCDVRDVLADWFAPADVAAWEAARVPRRHEGRLLLPGWRSSVPVAVSLWPTSRSYTGQPLAELHLPGSPPLLETVLQTAFAHGARPARPGEFTLRAFLAGRVDLLQAEAVLGVIDAADHRELTAALGQLAGGLSHRLAELRGDLLELLADLEAGLDFVEEHLEFVSREEIVRRTTAAAAFVDALRHQMTGRMHAGDLPRVVLAGLPNAGKSTLFNALVGADRALVSPVAGTTRDYLTAEVDWSGQRLLLVDTAGWDDATDPLGATMQALRSEQLTRADLVVWCTAADATFAERDGDDRLRRTVTAPVLGVVTKSDLATFAPSPPSSGERAGVRGRALRQTRGGTSNLPETNAPLPTSGSDRPLTLSPEAGERGQEGGTASARAIAVSARTGRGLDELRARISAALGARAAGQRQWIGASAARCQDSLRAAAESLHRAVAGALGHSTGEELIAVELRLALDRLGEIVGAVYTDDLLDRIFSKFCIGK
jgi:tRNA modification GTPase